MSSNKIVAAQDRNNTNSNLVDLLSFIQIPLLSVLKQYSHKFNRQYLHNRTIAIL